jgi:hypothetical protein
MAANAPNRSRVRIPVIFNPVSKAGQSRPKQVGDYTSLSREVTFSAHEKSGVLDSQAFRATKFVGCPEVRPD